MLVTVIYFVALHSFLVVDGIYEEIPWDRIRVGNVRYNENLDGTMCGQCKNGDNVLVAVNPEYLTDIASVRLRRDLCVQIDLKSKILVGVVARECANCERGDLEVSSKIQEEKVEWKFIRCTQSNLKVVDDQQEIRRRKRTGGVSPMELRDRLIGLTANGGRNTWTRRRSSMKDSTHSAPDYMQIESPSGSPPSPMSWEPPRSRMSWTNSPLRSPMSISPGARSPMDTDSPGSPMDVTPEGSPMQVDSRPLVLWWYSGKKP